jgi:hypothetical protein
MSPANLSVVLVTDRFSTIEDVIDALDRGTARNETEVVIVLPSHEAHGVDESRLANFAGHRIVTVTDILPMPAARAAGVRAATAPIIFIGETHSFPHPEFAREIIRAHEGPWDIVVPGLENANPSGPRSWSSFLLDYGYWLSALPHGEIASGPTWNASYKRDVLLELGPMLDDALSSGDELPMALRERRKRFYFAPAAKISHVNLEARGWTDERYLSGLVVGANRGKRWSPARRAAYFLAAPLIPLVLLYRNANSMRSLYRRKQLPLGFAVAIFAGSVIRTAGEAVGYLRGISPEASARMEEYELRKVSYVSRVAGWDELG